MAEHEWAWENLDAYLAGALPATELARVAGHVADCGDCKRALAQAQKMETIMDDLFAEARPDVNMEERLVHRLRKARPPRRYPAWTRFAIAAAAMVLIGAVGAVVQVVMGGGQLGGLRMASGNDERNDLARLGRTYFGAAKIKEIEGKATFGVADVDPAATQFDMDIQYKNERLGEFSVPGARNPDEAVGIRDGEKGAAPVDLPSTGGFGNQGQGGAVEVNGKPAVREWAYGGGAPLGGSVYGRGDVERAPTSITGGAAGGKAKMLEGLASAGRLTPNEAMLKTKKQAFDLGMYTKANAPGNSTAYFKPNDSPPVTRPSVGAGPPPDPNMNVEATKREEREKLPGESTVLALNQPAKPQPPAETGLKIIRTGDMEFEVDSFDNAVKTIMNLLKPLQPKGAFKLKEDSSKQANGKMRGHVVVRMPPQFLDDFVLDLRRDLAKVGELKLQQIGSQDVTKAYTDTESELKAARAVEKRLLAIIENGKGDVKDLVAAEKELGLWRMKIEKMEGEIRYYANQVALSTLTISLTEKEIQNAAALVVSETVKMRIEVDNVTKARQAAEKAVEQFKGRIVKSDEKQHPAGQVEAIVHAEIPPEQRDAFRRVLTQLGIVSAHEDTQSQATEGGSFPVITPRRKINDVLFQVTLNNIVNIRPKQSTKLDVVSADVRAGFEKLKDEIIRVYKGQIRDAKLDESQDKQKAIATIDFSVPTEKKADMDKLIASIGPTLDRVNTQAPITELSTEQKFGYQLTLYSIATVEPREKVRLHIEVSNVENRSAEIADLVKEAKGQMARPQSGLNRSGKTEALLTISVPLVQSDRLIRDIKEKGKLVDWAQAPNPSVPDNDLATAQIVVLLTGPSPIIPSDEGLSAYAQKSLYISFTVFAYCVLFIITGIGFILPWAGLILVIAICVWLVRRLRGKPAAVTAATPTTPEPPKT